MDAFLFLLFLICKNLHPDSIRDSQDFETFNQKLRVYSMFHHPAVCNVEIRDFFFFVQDSGPRVGRSNIFRSSLQPPSNS